MKIRLVSFLLTLLIIAPIAFAQQRPSPNNEMQRRRPWFGGGRGTLTQQSQFTNAEMRDPVYKFLKELHESGQGRGLFMANVPPQDGRLLQMLIKISGAKNVLEIGTSNGVSAIWMALGLKETGGKLTTLEIDPVKVKLAKENFQTAGVDDIVQVIEGDALQTLPTLTGSYDMVFIDAAKEQYKQYLDIIYSRIPKGSIIVAHNAVQQTFSMQDYLDFIQDNPELDTVILTTSFDGVALSYKK